MVNVQLDGKNIHAYMFFKNIHACMTWITDRRETVYRAEFHFTTFRVAAGL